MKVKLKAGKIWVSAHIEVRPNAKGEPRFFCKFPYNPALLALGRSLGDAKFEYETKEWHGDLGARTLFRLDFAIQGRENPYARWRTSEDTWPEIDLDRPYMAHQIKAIRQALECKRILWAQEMRTGKTLQAIKVLEDIGGTKQWWVSNKSGLVGVQVDFRKWKVKLPVEFMTYDQLVKRMANWDENEQTPTDLILDEVHKVKNPGTKRTHAVVELVEGMLKENKDPVVIAMSGTVAPKDPVDWWSPIEILCPGYLQESNTAKFRRRLGLVVDMESLEGGWYPKHITWFDDPKKCLICGHYKHNGIHNNGPPADKNPHDHPHKFKPSADEVGNLGKRLHGLVHVQHKKDCLDLPEMQDNYWYYNGEWKLTNDLEDIEFKPSGKFKKMATAIRTASHQAAGTRMKLRELSDGFQYKIEQSDEMVICPECKGEGSCLQFDEFEDEVFDECWKCDGDGKCAKEIRVGSRTETPKDDLLRQHLEEFEATGRNVVFTAFLESTDRVVDICVSEGWNVIRVDSRGWHYIGEYTFSSSVEALEAYANTKAYDKLVFVGHPESGGSGISLSASSCIIFYSNTDNAEHKLQARARIHDLGMDIRLGAVVQEYFHLEIDLIVLYNYLKKLGLYEKVAGDSHVKEISK